MIYIVHFTEKDLQVNEINNKSKIKNDEEDMKIIKEILSRIYGILNCQKEEKILNEIFLIGDIIKI